LRRLLPALVMGSGIVAMHYTGMAALEVMPGNLGQGLGGHFGRIALAASLAALWLTFCRRASRAGRADAHGCRHRGMPLPACTMPG
jgi:NO-binding membrane sensor protein with MHYT domain